MNQSPWEDATFVAMSEESVAWLSLDTEDVHITTIKPALIVYFASPGECHTIMGEEKKP